MKNPKEWYFIVDTSKPRALNALNTATRNDTGQIIAHYTGKEVKTRHTAPDGATVIEIQFTDGLTFDEYNKENGGKLKLLTSAEYDQWLNGQLKSICGDWKEITKKQYYYSLECVPPKRWRDLNENLNVFFVGECYTANLYTCCIHDKNSGRYFSALRPIGSTNEALINDFEKTPKTHLFKYLGQCDKLRQTEEGESNWQEMMKDPLETTRKAFIESCDITPLLDEDEEEHNYLNDLDKQGAKYFVSDWNNEMCLFIQVAGFEFVFK